MNANSVPAGNRNRSSRTSSSKASTPNKRKAFATPDPERSETSLSKLGPPHKTAIFLPNKKLFIFYSHNLNFSFQFDPSLFLGDRLDLSDQPKNLLCTCTAIVHDKVSV